MNSALAAELPIGASAYAVVEDGADAWLSR
jgi:hypothetical protein